MKMHAILLIKLATACYICGMDITMFDGSHSIYTYGQNMESNEMIYKNP